ncbi:RNA-binding ribosome biosynthesis protein mak21 [Coemansia spiralis]|uniref:RNA-binding ribosome biosynthesis protein mak21 n=2 Tax=Coemansia TaxID=4863 RepID=A0A9W8G0Q6_9FUNG|nr:CBF/Mak21 family-domain-containing protein [Coemansia spiralis]KAJ1990469.1 RNA-binding ribosome biosynthesis protein mak21 [Coemansia umbellata]KAJ2620775.1 RNA-binding ribosome biosynthesis protein mak21 [Coemansia sp. RSA 1358]KAJ2674635.1 RNA-binding ribosome biosynthesis protein mak21 [Coemansia spiralis]
MAKKNSSSSAAATKKEGAHVTKKNGSDALWEEIQKLGGDMEDLNMLQEVDTGKSGKSEKSAMVDKTMLKDDLSAFAKSLGLSTTIPDFVSIPDNKKPKGRSKNKAEDSGSKAKTNDDKKNSKQNKAEKITSKHKAEKIEAISKKDIKAENANNSNSAKDQEQKKQDEASGIPGFKIKSAKDAKPLAKSGRLMVEPNPQWFSISLPALEVDEDVGRPGEEEVLQKLQFAEHLLDGEGSLYEKRGVGQKSLSTADRSFVSNILSSGTLTDRVSALTLIVQESPVHNLRSLGQLMQMVNKKNRREALLAVSSVKDLMSINLLPSNRKLVYFADQPLNSKGITNAHWILWAFEDKLKKHYFDLIQIMESMSYDPVVHTRQNMVVYFEELLEQKPEQEQNLLRLLVNKLGDNERQLAAKASYLILKLLNVHPNMKFVVVKTIQELLLTKSSIKERAQYYTMITLNQIILSSKDVQAANLLLEVYFIFFKKLLKLTKELNDAEEAAANEDDQGNNKHKKSDHKKKVYIGQKALKKAKEEAEKKRAEEERSMDNKMLAAILTGLNRALPFSKMDDDVMDNHVGTIFQIAHAGNFNTVVQSLVLLHQIMRIRPAITDRFYRTLYDSLLDPRIDSTSKKAMYLNVLFRALKTDDSVPRIMAFVKRIMQICLYNQAEFASGALFLVSQILSINTRIYTMLTQPEDNDDEEKIVDAGSDDDSDEDDTAKNSNQASSSRYDPLKRDPQFAHADDSCLWEATMLMHHFHPSITHSTQQIFNGEQVSPINNLHNHSLAHFLDRFVFRKPKAEGGGASGKAEDDMDDGIVERSTTLRGQSIMQPFISKDGPDMGIGPNRARIAVGDYLIASKRTSGMLGGIDFTSEKIASVQKSDVPPDEQFFHQFFQTKKERMGKKAKKSKHGDDDDDDASEQGEFADDDTGFAAAVKRGDADNELGEDEIWQAMTASMPKVEGTDLGDDDIDADDDDDLLAALYEDESDLDANKSAEEEESGEGSEDDAESDEEGEDDSDDDGFPGFDDEISDADLDVAEDGSDTPVSSKRKSGDSDDKKGSSSKRKKSERLPLFGSFDDYAHLIDNDEGLE